MVEIPLHMVWQPMLKLKCLCLTPTHFSQTDFFLPVNTGSQNQSQSTIHRKIPLTRQSRRRIWKPRLWCGTEKVAPNFFPGHNLLQSLCDIFSQWPVNSIFNAIKFVVTATIFNLNKMYCVWQNNKDIMFFQFKSEWLLFMDPSLRWFNLSLFSSYPILRVSYLLQWRLMASIYEERYNCWVPG